MTTLVRYSGLNPDGQWELSQTAEVDDLPAFVAGKFADKWQHLEVLDKDRNRLGGIHRETEGGKPGWWVA